MQALGFLSFFKNLPDDPRAVRFFDLRDHYTAHSENATFILKTYYQKTNALLQLGAGSDGISSVRVYRNMFETFVLDLLLERTDHTIKLYEGSGSNWKLVRSGTPGNLGGFQDVLFANNDVQDSRAIVALLLNFSANGCTIGLSFIDLTKRVLGLAEFLDDSRFTNVESSLAALSCKECLLPLNTGKSPESRALLDLARCSVMVTEIED